MPSIRIVLARGSTGAPSVNLIVTSEQICQPARRRPHHDRCSSDMSGTFDRHGGSPGGPDATTLVQARALG